MADVITAFEIEEKQFELSQKMHNRRERNPAKRWQTLVFKLEEAYRDGDSESVKEIIAKLHSVAPLYQKA